MSQPEEFIQRIPLEVKRIIISSEDIAGRSNDQKTQKQGAATSYRMSFESLHACVGPARGPLM
jgi:hypothetical protein